MAYNGVIDIFLGIMQPLFPYTFDPVFTPLLGIGSPLTGARITIIGVSILLSALISIMYYLLMDVEEYQELKEKREELNEQMQEAREDGEMDAANDQMKEMASMQKEFFTVMLKPMIASMFVFFLILPWMYTTFTPIVTLDQGGNGLAGTIEHNGYTQEMTLVQEENTTALQIDGETYHIGDTFRMQDLPWKVKRINADGSPPTAKLAAEIVPLPVSLPFVGDELGWLGTYILVSIPFTFFFRKKLGIQ